ncbi:MAG: hypothetical protein BM485_15950 [Desulfobulbaceae bacterium DB1]|nr:MAG: hypothetical protein BM485_15950 [Desulfobulbaceae bacterium DB1]
MHAFLTLPDAESGELAFPGHGKMALSPDLKKIRELEKSYWCPERESNSHSYKEPRDFKCVA